MLRRRFLALFCAALPLLACTKLLDVDFDARDRNLVTPNDRPDGEDGDGGRLPDGAFPPETGDGAPTEQDILARLRVRVADATSAYFASSSWLYWTDTTNAGHGYRPVDKATRLLPANIRYGNDDFVIVADTPTVGLTYAADTSLLADTFTYGAGMPVALASGVVSFDLNAGDNTTIPKVWRPSAPGVHTPAPAIATIQPSMLGRAEDTIYLRDFAAPTKMFAFGLPAATTASIALPFAPIAVVPLGTTLVLVRFEGAFIGMQLLNPSRDLGAAINNATSTVPVEDRAPLDLPVAIDDWLIYSAAGGLLAFHPGDDRLIPLQLRSDIDSFTFDGVRALQGAKHVAFVITSGPTGLYVLDVRGLLGL